MSNSRQRQVLCIIGEFLAVRQSQSLLGLRRPCLFRLFVSLHDSGHYSVSSPIRLWNYHPPASLGITEILLVNNDVKKMRKSSVCERITYRESWDVQDTRMNDYNPCLDSSDVLGIDRFLFFV